MTLIQPLLIILVILTLWIYMSRLRSRLADRCIVLVAAVAGIALIAFPDVIIAIAHRVGVGRGVDLVIYLCLIGLAFTNLFSFSRVRSVEVQITVIVRELAISQAQQEQAERRMSVSMPRDLPR